MHIQRTRFFFPSVYQLIVVSSISIINSRKCPTSEFILVRIFPHSDGHEGLLDIFPYSVRMQGNTDQKKLQIWTL